MWLPYWLIRLIFSFSMFLPLRRKNAALKFLYRSLDSGIGKRSVFWRRRTLRALGARIGRRAWIGEKVIIDHPDKLSIGDNVSIQPSSYLACSGGIVIGDNVSIAHGVSIMSSTHRYENEKKIKMARLRHEPVHIGSNVWIGMKAMILLGVSIGDDVVVGAGALVNRDVPSNCVVAGVPAKKIAEVMESI